MPDYTLLAGTTSVSVNIFIFDPATGLPDNTVIHSTAGLVLQYRREGAANVGITEVTLAALTTAWTDSGFLLIGNGLYRLDLPNLACATGVRGVQIHGTLTSRVVIGPYVHLVAYDPFDAIRLGLTALPNVASGSAGAIPTTGTGSNQLSVASGHVTLADGSISSGKFVANSITASALAADAVAEIADGVWDEDIDAAHQTANTAGKRLDDSSTSVATNLDAAVSSRSTFDDTTDTVLLNSTTQAQIDSIESSFVGVGLPFVTTGTPSTTSVSISGVDLGDTTGDHNRQYCFFTSGGDGVVGIGRWITTYTNTGEGTGTLSFSGGANDPDGPLPNAPGAGVSGRILGRR